MFTCEEPIKRIDQTRNKVTQVKKNELVYAYAQEITDSFLDKILNFKTKFQEVTNQIEAIVSEFEKLTWIENRDKEVLDKIRELVEVSKVVYSNLLANYRILENSKIGEIASIEMGNHALALGDFEESIQDLEKAFFIYPEDNELNELIESLAH